VAVVYDKKLLVTKNWLSIQNIWRLPGGGLHKHETFIQGALRELYEETGIKLHEDSLSVLTEPTMHEKHFEYQIFLANIDASKTKLKLQKPEISEAEFVEIDKLRKTPSQIEYEVQKILNII